MRWPANDSRKQSGQARGSNGGANASGIPTPSSRLSPPPERVLAGTKSGERAPLASIKPAARPPVTQWGSGRRRPERERERERGRAAGQAPVLESRPAPTPAPLGECTQLQPKVGSTRLDSIRLDSTPLHSTQLRPARLGQVSQ